jgi:hypothetical protein
MDLLKFITFGPGYQVTQIPVQNNFPPGGKRRFSRYASVVLFRHVFGDAFQQAENADNGTLYLEWFFRQ